MADPDPLVSAQDVAAEPGVDIDAAQIPERWLQRAARTVDRRLPNETDEWLLAELQLLVTAHFAYPVMTGETAGRRVSRIEQADGSISYENADSGGDPDDTIPGGFQSPFWDQAVALDNRMDRDESFESYTL